MTEIPKKNQWHRRSLTHPQGALRYTDHNEGNGAKNRKLA